MTLKGKVARLPRRPGVYLWKDGETILYVGKAQDLRSRATNYFSDRHPKTQRLIAAATDIDYIAVKTQKEALILEQTLIKRHRPRYNVLLTDDKQYPYIKLTNDAYPRLVKTHRRLDDGATYFGPFPDGYGAYHVMHTLNDAFPLRRCKTIPKQKCLYYDIGKCVAPCIDACTDDEYHAIVDEVAEVLRGRSKRLLRRVRDRMQEAAEAHRFEEAARLRDQLKGLEGVLERQHMAADRLQDRDIFALEARGDAGVAVVLHQRDGKVVGQSPFVLAGLDGTEPSAAVADFIRGHYADRTVPRFVTAALAASKLEALEADLRELAGSAVTVESPERGEKVRWLEVARTNAALRLEEELIRRTRRGMGAVEALQTALGLATPPRVIEGFDVSHHAGKHTRAAMVRFVDGEADKQGYRTFNMRDVGEDAVAAGTAKSPGGRGAEVDDLASMAEAVTRRYKRLQEAEQALPDLVVIDGGPGQLSAARKALQDVGAEVALCSLAKREEEVFVPSKTHPIKLPRDHAGLQLLQRVRDEAHRFGIRQVRKKATTGATGSPLDGVPGIGPMRRAELVKAFGGLEGLRQASADDLMVLQGITAEIAAAVVQALRQTSVATSTN